jgi:hypothetical protein
MDIEEQVFDPEADIFYNNKFFLNRKTYIEVNFRDKIYNLYGHFEPKSIKTSEGISLNITKFRKKFSLITTLGSLNAMLLQWISPCTIPISCRSLTSSIDLIKIFVAKI